MRSLTFVLASVIVTSVFNIFSLEIFDFNAALRTLITKGSFERRSFDDSGIPIYKSPRIGNYTSAFYVVHYGLEYSEACRDLSNKDGKFHWRHDPTTIFWHSSPFKASLVNFRNSVDWIVANTEYDANGNAHLFYKFDWPYKNHFDGMLRAPWWSGLAEGHAITLLMRAADCFGDERYMRLADDFYKSILTRVEQGGSLLSFNDLPWIEEYVDPRAPVDALSRVFNGMAYAYFGIEAFEQGVGIQNMAPALRESIVRNAREFDMGYWSYYDAIGNEANIKYHAINLALLNDPILQESSLQEMLDRWELGRRFVVPFYLLNGPTSVAKYHFFSFYIFAVLLIYLVLITIIKRVRN